MINDLYIYILYVYCIYYIFIYIYTILTEGKTIIIRRIVRLDTFVYDPHSTYRTKSEEGLLDMYFNVLIDWKGNILGINGMQPHYESIQNFYSRNQGRENPIRKRQVYIRR
jgi:hypothetical protein